MKTTMSEEEMSRWSNYLLNRMTSRDFVYWIQGLFELSDPKELNAKQTELIKRHLALVFKHDIDPSMGGKNIQEALNKIHNTPTYCAPSTLNNHLIEGSGSDTERLRC